MRHQVALILASPPAGALAAKAATTAIPVCFLIAGDPVRLGLVPSLGRPGKNLSGTNFYVASSRRSNWSVHQLAPKAVSIGVLVDPSAPAVDVESRVRDLELAAQALGLRLQVVDVGSEAEAERGVRHARRRARRRRIPSLLTGVRHPVRDSFVDLAARTVFQLCPATAISSLAAD